MLNLLRRVLIVGALISLSACMGSSGLALIKEKCVACHPYEKIYGGRPADKWPEVVARMREMNPSLLSEDQAREITKYLQEDLKG